MSNNALAADATIDELSLKNDTSPPLFNASERIQVTNQAMGARCAVAADFDGDGLMDLVSASSTDNAVSWFRNEGKNDDGQVRFSIKRQITWNSLGSRIVTVGDMDGDGDIDVIGASYYDSSLRWFENVINEPDQKNDFIKHDISTTVNEGQGVTVADLDNDGDPDIASASSGDNTIAVFYNLANGTFCEIKEVVDDDAIGARTVVAADLNGDGWLDLASASKDDNTVAWYPNDQTGHFPVKHIISRGNESMGAYSLVAEDIDGDGTVDLVVASNGNDHVSLWRNTDGTGMKFEKTLIYGNSDFVLSVTAVDFDRDGDIDVASAGFFDGYIRWHENIDGKGYEWKNHTIYVGGIPNGNPGFGGHYVSNNDMDGDGDADLIAVNHHENSVYVFLANTECNSESGQQREECCRVGSQWNGTACEACPRGTYGTLNITCEACPKNSCTIPGWNVVPPTCAGITGCIDIEESLSQCSCPSNHALDPSTFLCEACAEGQIRDNPTLERGVETLGNYTLWEQQQGLCYLPDLPELPESNQHIYEAIIYSLVGVFLALLLLFAFLIYKRRSAELVWQIDKKELVFSDPPEIAGRGTFGLVIMAEYRGTTVAVKRVIPPKEIVNTIESMKGRKSGSPNDTSTNPGHVTFRLPDDIELGSSTNDESKEASLSSVPKRRVSLQQSLGHDSMGSIESIVDPSHSLYMPKLKKTNSRRNSFIFNSLDARKSVDSRKSSFRSSFRSLSASLRSNPKQRYLELKQDFIEEMRTLSKLRHPCITTVSA